MIPRGTGFRRTTQIRRPESIWKTFQFERGLRTKIPYKRPSTTASVAKPKDPVIKPNTEQKQLVPVTVPAYPPHNPHFEKLKVNGRLTRAMTDLGYETPTAIQKAVMIQAIRGHNIVASAKTGTGKTAAYMIPALHRLHLTLCEEKRENIERIFQPLVLVLTPTQELTEQVKKHAVHYSKYLEGVEIMEFVGGSKDALTKKNARKKKIDVLISTPGRILNFLKQPENEGFLDKVQSFVVDECDKMLNMGFLPDIIDIWNFVPRPKKRSRRDHRALQIMLFSATVVPQIENFIKRLCPTHHRVNLNKDFQPPHKVKQTLYLVTARRKYRFLLHLLRRNSSPSLKDQQVLVFVRTKLRADRLAENLKEEGFACASLHKDHSKQKRNKVVELFSKGEIKILVATDIMSRGMDIPSLPYVVNFDVPAVPEDYVHRIGRTGRAGEAGNAITFVSREPQVINMGKTVVERNELHYIKNIETLMKKKLNFSDPPAEWRDPPTDTKLETAGNEKLLALRKASLVQILEKRAKEEDEKLQKQKELEAWRANLRVPGSRKLQPLPMTKTEKREIAEQKMAEKKEKDRELFRRKLEIPELDVPLRNFKEGRYEEVINAYNAKRAINRGIFVKKKGKIVFRGKSILKKKKKRDDE